MESAAITTVVKMLETLPEPAQQQVVEHLKAYIAEIQDEEFWDGLFSKTYLRLVEAARRARKQIAEGKASQFDESQL